MWVILFLLGCMTKTTTGKEMYIKIIEAVFGSALFINAMLFIPQILKILQKKSAQDVSLTTFSGFLLIQFSTLLHGVIWSDWLLVGGMTLSMIACGTIVVLTASDRIRRRSGQQ